MAAMIPRVETSCKGRGYSSCHGKLVSRGWFPRQYSMSCSLRVAILILLATTWVGRGHDGNEVDQRTRTVRNGSSQQQQYLRSAAKLDSKIDPRSSTVVTSLASIVENPGETLLKDNARNLSKKKNKKNKNKKSNDDKGETEGEPEDGSTEQPPADTSENKEDMPATDDVCPDGSKCENGSKCVEVGDQEGAYSCECTEGTECNLEGSSVDEQSEAGQTPADEQPKEEETPAEAQPEAEDTPAAEDVCPDGSTCENGSKCVKVADQEGTFSCECIEGTDCKSDDSPEQQLEEEETPGDANDVCPDGRTCENGSKCVEVTDQEGTFSCECIEGTDCPSEESQELPLEGEANEVCPDGSTCENGTKCEEVADQEGTYSCECIEGTDCDLDDSPQQQSENEETSTSEVCPDGRTCEHGSKCAANADQEGAYSCECAEGTGCHAEEEETPSDEHSEEETAGNEQSEAEETPSAEDVCPDGRTCQNGSKCVEVTDLEGGFSCECSEGTDCNLEDSQTAMVGTPAFEVCPDGRTCENGSKCEEMADQKGNYSCMCIAGTDCTSESPTQPEAPTEDTSPDEDPNEEGQTDESSTEGEEEEAAGTEGEGEEEEMPADSTEGEGESESVETPTEANGALEAPVDGIEDGAGDGIPTGGTEEEIPAEQEGEEEILRAANEEGDISITPSPSESPMVEEGEVPTEEAGEGDVPTAVPTGGAGEGDVPTAVPTEAAGEGDVPTAVPTAAAGEGDVPTAVPTETAGEGDVPTSVPTEATGEGDVPTAVPTEAAGEGDVPAEAAGEGDVPSAVPTEGAGEGDVPSEGKGEMPTDGGEEMPTDETNSGDEDDISGEVKAGGWVFVLAIFGMIFTAYQMSENPDGVYASVCRLAITITGCAIKILLIPFKYMLGSRFPGGGHRHHPISQTDYREPYRGRHGDVEFA